jgi:hypothetical protein
MGDGTFPTINEAQIKPYECYQKQIIVRHMTSIHSLPISLTSFVSDNCNHSYECGSNETRSWIILGERPSRIVRHACCQTYASVAQLLVVCWSFMRTTTWSVGRAVFTSSVANGFHLNREKYFRSMQCKISPGIFSLITTDLNLLQLDASCKQEFILAVRYQYFTNLIWICNNEWCGNNFEHMVSGIFFKFK